MKKSLLSVILLFIIWAGHAGEVRLPVAVAPLKGDILNNVCWDFSRQDLIDDNAGTSVRVYGDSLLSEIFNGRRFWYGLRRDSLSFLGEEDRLTAIVVDSTAFVARTPLNFGFVNAGVAFEAHGKGAGRQFGVQERGSLEFACSPRPGVLILSPGDTITDVLAVRERRYITAVFPEDSIAKESHFITEIFRWYDSFGTVALPPVAVQRRMYAASPLSAEAVPTFSAAYLPDTGETALHRQKQTDDFLPGEQAPDTGAIEAALQNAVITCDGRSVTVQVAMPQPGLSVAIDVVDAAGRLYLHECILSSGATDGITVDCSGLRPGQYIAVVGVEELPVEPLKKMIIIR